MWCVSVCSVASINTTGLGIEVACAQSSGRTLFPATGENPCIQAVGSLNRRTIDHHQRKLHDVFSLDSAECRWKTFNKERYPAAAGAGVLVRFHQAHWVSSHGYLCRSR